jgi:hypothetical protein
MADGRPHKPRLKDGVLGRPLSASEGEDVAATHAFFRL